MEALNFIEAVEQLSKGKCRGIRDQFGNHYKLTDGRIVYRIEHFENRISYASILGEWYLVNTNPVNEMKREERKMEDKMSIEEMHFYHFKIWSEVVKREYCNEDQKQQIARDLKLDFIYGCPACHFSGISHETSSSKKVDICEKRCPLEWGTFNDEDKNEVPCMRSGSPYRKWCLSRLREDALEILLIPLREFPIDKPVVQMGIRINISPTGQVRIQTKYKSNWLSLFLMTPEGRVSFIDSGMEDGDGFIRNDAFIPTSKIFPEIKDKTFQFIVEDTKID